MADGRKFWDDEWLSEITSLDWLGKSDIAIKEQVKFLLDALEIPAEEISATGRKPRLRRKEKKGR